MAADARALFDDARVNPASVRATAEALLASPEQLAGLSNDNHLLVLLALGWATFSQGDVGAATSALTRAERIVTGTTVEQSATMQLARLQAAILMEQGEFTRAEEQLDRALATAPPADRPRLWSAFGGTQAAVGNFNGAIESYARGLAAIVDDEVSVRRALLNNRASAAMEVGLFDVADRDLQKVRTPECEQEDPYLYALATHNSGTSAARQGRLAQGIRFFDDAASRLEEAGDQVSLAYALADQARLFLDAGLFDEGAGAAQRALSIFASLDSPLRMLEVLRIASRIQSANQDWLAALASALQAQDLAAERNIDPAIQAEVAGQVASLRLITAIDSGASQSLGDLPEFIDASHDLDVVVDAGLLAWRHGHVGRARQLMAAACAAGGVDSALADAHHAVAEAVLQVLDGNLDEALAIVARELVAARERSAVLGVAELRILLQRRTEQLARVALRIFIEREDIEAIASTLELERAAALVSEPDLSHVEVGLAAQLRATHRALEQRPLAASDKIALWERRSELERELTTARRVRNPERSQDAVRSTASSVFVETYLLDGELWALRTDTETLVRIGPIEPLARPIRALRMTLSSLAAQTASPSIDKLVSSLRTQLAPLLDLIDGEDRVVMIPELLLEQVPWSLLTTTPIAHVPSKKFAAIGPAAEHQIMVAIGGPGLVYAGEEVRAVAAAYQNSVMVPAEESTCDRVLAELSEATTVHFATHGAFRTDSPLYSSLTMADGPLTLLDLLATSAPQRLIFSACDFGRSASRSAIGLASLVLGRGCEAVVASSGLTNDQSAVALMTSMHARLAEGSSTAVALRAAQQPLLGEAPSVALFSCFGIG